MRLSVLVPAAGFWLAAAFAAGAQVRSAPTGLATAAIDRDLFREGEVRRRNERFGAWSLDCDEIPRLGQRYCSMRTLARDAAGVAIATFVLSTDDRGRPAALMTLPLGLDLFAPAMIEPARSLLLAQPSTNLAAATREIAKAGKPAADGAVATDILRFPIRPAFCDSVGCHAVLALKPADIAALRAGAGLRLRFSASGRDPRGFLARGHLPPRPIEAVITSDGFDQSLEASLR